MELTKHTHATVTIERNGTCLAIDPGGLTPNAAELIAQTQTVLITHEHFDHFNEELLAAAISDRPDLHVFGPASVVARWDGRPGQVIAVREGSKFTSSGFEIAVYGELHAPVHDGFPRVSNVGYVIDDNVYHPGDSYVVPPAKVETLLVPTSGVWTSLLEAGSFSRAINPRQMVQIHEIMLSDIGQIGWASFLNPDHLSPVPLTILPDGSTIDV